MKKNKIVAILGAFAILMLAGQPIFAQKAFLKKLKELVPDADKKVANCALCHTYDKDKKEHPEKKNINALGKELQADPNMKTVINQKEGDEHKYTDAELANVEAALKVVLKKDTKGNGKTNEENIKAGVNPGVK